MDKARSEIVATAVSHGWIRHLHHDQRTPDGKELSAKVREFQRSLRRAGSEQGQDVLTGPLLPYALRFGLITDEEIPLARFAHAWVRVLVHEPGWTPSQPGRTSYDEVPISNSERAIDRDLRAVAYLDFGSY
jgi:hypothetical protein